jgi:hypothetical protein
MLRNRIIKTYTIKGAIPMTTIISPIKQTEQPTIILKLSVKQTISRLRAANLCLYASKSKGRFICRIADQTGTVVSIATRSTLEGAIVMAVGNALA